ncbi:monocarboxylate transporter 3-like isoform X2 [Mercenaria mercenaria]|uniref:monocarboxylate transporter 3-like isoform X2 n=1 Tax=Mercenaria mercenaria TaxID=6596 RepID=UPI00234ECD26|nr:monocarboxylate transporter 3-like isoform X2 [Mercenaria mercenaria]
MVYLMHLSTKYINRSPVSSIVTDRFSCRVAIVLSGIFFIIGYLGTAFATNVRVAILTCGIIGGIGAGLGCNASLVVIGFNFDKRRDLALGISLSGVGTGVFVLAPLMQATRDYYGSIGFFVILAAMSANIVTCGMLCFPSQMERHAKSERNRDRLRSKLSSNNNHFFAVIRTYVSVLANRGVILMCSSFFIYSIGSFLVYLHLPHYIESKGHSGAQAAFLVALIGIISAVSRILTGLVANTHRIDNVIIYSVSIAIFGSATLVYPFIADNYSGHVIYVCFVGLFYGCCYVVSAGVHVNFVGINYISSAVGLQFFCGGAGGIIGPVFAGVLVDQGGTYNQSIIVAACCLLISSILGAVLLCIPKPAIIKDAPSDKCKTDGDECETTFDLNDDDNKRL